MVSVLAAFLEPSVWILGYRPNRYTQWWDTAIPLNTYVNDLTLTVRDPSFGLQILTTDFLSRAEDFDDHGLVLIQSNQQMPDTLWLDAIAENQQDSVLMQNGSPLRIYLPHAIETAQVKSFTKGHLATVIGT